MAKTYKIHHQSRISSLNESLINIASGFILSLGIWVWVIMPYYDLQFTMIDNLSITGIFTISAIIRGYFWRRFFNKKLIKKQKEML